MPITFSDDQRRRCAASADYWIASVKSSPAAHIVPIWAVMLDDEFYMLTSPKSQKVKNIVAHPRIALCLPDTSHPIILEGDARLTETLPEAVRDAFRSKYNWNVTSNDEETTLIILTPDKMMSW